MRILIAALSLLITQVIQAEIVPVVVAPDVLKDYQNFVDGRQVEDIGVYGGSHARFDVIELVLLQQALKRGGFDGQLKFDPEQSLKRTLMRVADGHEVLAANSFWHSMADEYRDELFITEPVISEMSIATGFYTCASNTRALASKSLEDLKTLSFVSNSNWLKSWTWLDSLEPAQLYDYNSWPAMVRMVASQRADVVIAPFANTPDLSMNVGGVTLVPIVGLKLLAAGSRHYAVSKKHSQGQAVYQALQKGLTELRKDGTLSRAYQESGLFHPQVSNWQVVGVRPE